MRTQQPASQEQQQQQQQPQQEQEQQQQHSPPPVSSCCRAERKRTSCVSLVVATTVVVILLFGGVGIHQHHYWRRRPASRLYGESRPAGGRPHDTNLSEEAGSNSDRGGGTGIRINSRGGNVTSEEEETEGLDAPPLRPTPVVQIEDEGTSKGKGTHGDGGDNGGGHGEGEGATLVLPRCYSTPEADPSEGAWRRLEGGVSESPASMSNWTHPYWDFAFLTRCREIWKEGHKGKGPRPYWTWEPKKCSLEEVTAAKICRVLERRKGLLLVGDSLTRLSTTTLASILRAEPIVNESSRDVYSACEGKLNIRYLRNDYLDVSKKGFQNRQCLDSQGGPADNALCRVFANDYTLKYFDTLVVNSGAHPRPVDDYRAAMVEASKALAASMRRLHGDDAILVVRNTSPGHWQCTKRMFDAPVNSNVAARLVARSPEKYAWSSFADYNKALTEAFSTDDGWRLLDAYSPTFLRADSHIGGNDCLHYCVPGPADHWITLLYNILLAATDDAGGEERGKEENN